VPIPVCLRHPIQKLCFKVVRVWGQPKQRLRPLADEPVPAGPVRVDPILKLNARKALRHAPKPVYLGRPVPWLLGGLRPRGREPTPEPGPRQAHDGAGQKREDVPEHQHAGGKHTHRTVPV
jgi:hypothetical protein